MGSSFFTRLAQYYENVAQVLRGEAATASIFPNTTDIGVTREGLYAEFLRQHAPKACNVFLGGFLFNLAGAESSQLDVIVTTDDSLQFNFSDQRLGGKAFAAVEGAVAVASIKSTLTSSELWDALDNIASIPDNQNLTTEMKGTFVQLSDFDYADMPYKIIYATGGMTPDSCSQALLDYYHEHPVPPHRCPNFIHVAGKYWIQRTGPDQVLLADGKVVPPFAFVETVGKDFRDDAALALVTIAIQNRLAAQRWIMHDYRNILRQIPTSSEKFTHRVVKGASFYYALPKSETEPAGTFERAATVHVLQRFREYSQVQMENGEERMVSNSQIRPKRVKSSKSRRRKSD